MTLEELLAVAEIVEKLTYRYRDQEAAHKAALTEIRASFNARTGADEKIIEGLRIQVQDMRAEMERLREDERKAYQAGVALQAEVAALQERLRDSQSRDINDGDLVEVVSNTGRNTWLADVGSVGTVTSIETINDSISVCLDDVPGKKNALAGYVSLCDVRKVTT